MNWKKVVEIDNVIGGLKVIIVLGLFFVLYVLYMYMGGDEIETEPERYEYGTEQSIDP